MNKVVKSCVIILLLVILAVGGIFWYYRYSLNLRSSLESKEVGFEVKKGWGVTEIAQSLSEKELIKSRFAFRIYVLFSGNDASLKAGVFAIPKNATITEVVEVLVRGEEMENKVTILEGWRMEEIVAYLEEKGLFGDFLATAKVTNYRDEYTFLEGLDSDLTLQGYIFPDTYILSTEPTADELISKALENFEEKIKEIAPSNNEEILNLRGLVILASVVERESATDGSENEKIAGVFVNRIKNKMKLEADPTVQYARDTFLLSELKKRDSSASFGTKFEFWKPIAEDKLETYKSSYNTYLHPGLPEGPICNPGIDSLYAAFHPENHGYFYFFHRKNGEIVFSETAEQHESRRQD